MKQAHIFYKDQLAGILTENDAGYEFCYLPEYLSLEKAKARMKANVNFELTMELLLLTIKEN